MRFKKILVPHDFSELCAAVPPIASDMARAFGSQLVMLHVYRPIAYHIGEVTIPAQPERLAKDTEQLEERLRKDRARFFPEDVEVSTRVVVGEPFVEIVRIAREEAFELIVMGTHGHTGLKHVLIGSVAERVVRKAPCPVLTVRPEDHDFEHP